MTDQGPPQRGLWSRFALFYRRHELTFLLGLGVATVVLGFVGLRRYHVAAGDVQTPLEVFYQTLTIFSLGLGVSGDMPWELELARFLGPTVLAMAGVKALLAIFEEQYQWYRARSARGHVLVCGLSNTGRHLALEYLEQGQPVVVLELDEGNDHVRALRDEGAIVLLGDAKDDDVLRRAGAHRCRYVVASCGDDGTNVEIAVATNKLLREVAPEGDPIQCFIHIGELFLLSQFKQQYIFKHTVQRLQVRFFNLPSLAARALFGGELALDLADAGARERVGITVIGFGALGQSVAVQAAYLAHFGGGERIRIHVVDREADRLAPIFQRNFPSIESICDLEYHTIDMRGPELLDRTRTWVDEGLHATIVCLDRDSVALSCALSLAPLTGKRPMAVFLDENAGLAAFLSDKDFTEIDHIFAFGTRDQTCSPQVVVDEVQDILAQAIHDYYRALYGGPEWSALPDYQRDSNRLAADHLPIKLQTIGCTTESGDGGHFEFTAAEIEVLARMEHARWSAEKRLDGWRHGSSRDDDQKLHPDLASWEELAESAREKNREAVRALPAILALVKRRISRC